MTNLKRPPRVREDGTIEILLTKGYVALIDPEDAWLAEFNWCATGDFPKIYAQRNRGRYILHREILGLHKGDPRLGDHKNGDTLDCRRYNLRISNNLENSRNRKLNSNNTSGCLGVSFLTNDSVWTVSVGKFYVGRFSNFEDAKIARLITEKRLWGVHPQRELAMSELRGDDLPQKRVVKHLGYRPTFHLRKKSVSSPA